MSGFNKVILMGNLTRDPEVRYTPSGTAVCDIGLAVGRVWYDKQSGQKKEETTFVDVTLWARQAEIAGEYLAKGRPVLVEGRLHLDQWDDRETGQKRSRLKVICENMKLVGGRGDSSGSSPRTGSSSAAPPSGGFDAGPPDDSGGYEEHPSGPPPEDEVPF